MSALTSLFGRLASVVSHSAQNPLPSTPAQGKKPQRCQPLFEALEGRQLMSASVSGIVYNDLNVANTFKTGDPMLAGVRVYADLGNHNAYKAGVTIINNFPANDASVTNYSFSQSGTLPAGQYVLSFQVYNGQTSHFGTNSYLMNFNI